MDPSALTPTPFAALTFVAAPALLTNASSLLALSTINRMLRTRERMHELFMRSEAGGQGEAEASRQIEEVTRVEKQATLLLRALRSIYIALAAFASATLVTLLGAGMAASQGAIWLHLMEWLGLGLGFVGVGLRQSFSGDATLAREYSRGSGPDSPAPGDIVEGPEQIVGRR